MKSKNWLKVSTTAKHWSIQQQLPYVTCIRPPPLLYKDKKQQQQQKRQFSIDIPKLNAATILQEYHHPQQHRLPLLDFFSKAYAKPSPSYIFVHGASGFAKRQHYTTPDSLKKANDYYYSTQIGEDAYFRRSDALGVADGVGGWAGESGK